MRLALFDMDGTLIDSMGVWEYAPAGALKLLGIAPDKEAFEVFRTKGYRETAKYLIAKYELDMDRHEFMDLMDKAVVPFYQEEVQLKDGVLGYLAYLKRSNVKTCLISANKSELVDIIKTRFGLDTYISDFLTTTDFGLSKGDPELFIKLAHHYKVELSECVLFEDSRYAIETANALGVKTVAVKDRSSKKDEAYLKQHCTRFISSFTELLADGNL